MTIKEAQRLFLAQEQGCIIMKRDCTARNSLQPIEITTSKETYFFHYTRGLMPYNLEHHNFHEFKAYKEDTSCRMSDSRSYNETDI